MTDRFARHGPVRVAPGGRHLAHADGTPFFYLADTAWNGALLASDADWREYLSDRRAKGFTAIQFVTMPWAGAYADAEGRVAYAVEGRRCVADEPFWRRMDERVRAVTEAGLLAVPVLAWAANFGESAKHNPGVALGEEALAGIIDFQVRRYEDRHVMWVLAGDGRYGALRSFRWKRIGRRVFGRAGNRAPVAMHPMGMTWPYGWFRRESWLDVLGYQSGHSDDPRTVGWLKAGPAARASARGERRPVINLEPCYEGIRNWARGSSGVFTNAEVRRATYGSLLSAATAGVTYGAHGVWSWESEPREPLNHAGVGVARPWREAMGFAGSADVGRMAGLFTSLAWWRLRRATHWVSWTGQDARRLPWVAAADDGSVAVAYVPHGGTLALNPERVAGMAGEWFDPRTGEKIAARSSDGQFAAPTEDDWVLVLRRDEVRR